MKLILECRVNVNEKGGRASYPFIRAVHSKECPDSLLLLLLKYGADPNAELNNDSEHAMWYRTALQPTSSVRKATLLLDYGAQINAVAGKISTALHASIERDDTPIELTKLLIGRGADIDNVAESVESPLLIAFSKGKKA